MGDEALAADGQGDDEEVADKTFPFHYPLVLRSDMSKNQILKVIRMVTSALDQTQGDIPLTLKDVKRKLDEAYRPYWNIVIGQDFGYRLWSHQTNFVHLAIGKLGVLVWKV